MPNSTHQQAGLFDANAFHNHSEELAYNEHKLTEQDPHATKAQKVIAFYRWLSAFHGESVEPPSNDNAAFKPAKTRPKRSRP